MYNINCGGVFLSAVSCAKQMIKYKTPGSMILVGSMSGLNANKGFTSCIYNSSKAGVIQMGRSLAMEVSIYYSPTHCINIPRADIFPVGSGRRRQSHPRQCAMPRQYHDADGRE